ncbi:MAG: HEAT repeat domain-containing protein [Candidatus Desulfaltia sp.]|nr:HEAT repeat domain-containing protein [Candidatus Desulfaltia sp.]
MSFRTTLKKYSDKFVVMSWYSDSNKKYSPENICNLLRDRDTFVKYCGILKFQTNDSRNIGLFYKMINNEREIIRYAVVSKLAGIKNSKSISILTKALNDDSRYVREAVLRSLREIADINVVENIYPLLSDKWHNVRLEAAKTLYFLDEDEPIQYILDLLKDKSEMNRLAGIKFIRDHKKRFGIYAVGPVQAVGKHDRKGEVRKEAGELAQYLLEMGVLDNIWDKIITQDDYYQIFDIVDSLSRIDDKQASEILGKVLSFPFVMEKEFDFEEEEEIKSVAIDFFMQKYQNTGDKSFLDELFGTLLHNYNNSILSDHIVFVLSMCRLDDVLKKAEFLLLENLDDEDYANLLRIIISIGGDAAIDVLNDFFEQYSDDSGHIQGILFYDGEANELFDFLSNSKNAKAHQLLANFLESEFYEFLDDELKKKCIIAAGTTKAAIAIKNLSDILLNKDEDMIIRRKAAQALGAIGTKRAAAALNKVGKDKYASNNLKKVATSLRSQIK